MADKPRLDIRAPTLVKAPLRRGTSSITAGALTARDREIDSLDGALALATASPGVAISPHTASGALLPPPSSRDTPISSSSAAAHTHSIGIPGYASGASSRLLLGGGGGGGGGAIARAGSGASISGPPLRAYANGDVPGFGRASSSAPPDSPAGHGNGAGGGGYGADADSSRLPAISGPPTPSSRGLSSPQAGGAVALPSIGGPSANSTGGGYGGGQSPHGAGAGASAPDSPVVVSYVHRGPQPPAKSHSRAALGAATSRGAGGVSSGPGGVGGGGVGSGGGNSNGLRATGAAGQQAPPPGGFLKGLRRFFGIGGEAAAAAAAAAAASAAAAAAAAAAAVDNDVDPLDDTTPLQPQRSQASVVLLAKHKAEQERVRKLRQAALADAGGGGGGGGGDLDDDEGTSSLQERLRGKSFTASALADPSNPAFRVAAKLAKVQERQEAERRAAAEREAAAAAEAGRPVVKPTLVADGWR